MTTQTSQAVEAAVQQPEALRLAAWLNEGAWHQMKLGDVEAAGRELRRLHNETVALRAALTSQQEVAEGEELRQRHLDLLQDVLDAKDVMRAAGIGQCDFPTMFKEFAASRSPAAGVAGGVGASPEIPKGWEKSLDEVMTERDRYHEVADDLAAQIAAITGQELGEHSSGNDPWRNAMLDADEFIAQQLRDMVSRASRGQDSFHVANAETKGVQDAATVAVWEPSKYGSPEMQSLILSKLATPAAQGDGREAKSYSGSVHLGSGAGGNVHGRAVVSAYSIQISDKPFAEEITVQRMRQIDGTPLWSVKLGGNCLNKSGEWEWEPMPSSRDDEFLARCRFESPEAAIDAAILSTKGTT